jgi:hypothetical protein
LAVDDRDPSAKDDAVVEAIDEVSSAVEENVSDEQDLLSELARVRHERMAGAPLRETLGETGQPRALVLLSRLVDRLTVGSARMRRALVVSLKREGESVTSIARLFQVTHQRISSILRRDND